MDLEGVCRHTSIDNFNRFYADQQDFTCRIRYLAASMQSGHFVSQSMVVIDLSGISVFKFLDRRVITFVQGVISMNNEHFPEMCGKFFIINAPRAMDAFWNNFIALALDERTKKKINIYSTNERSTADMKKALADSASAEQLPECLGGTIPDD